jgi:hypothetical protein
MVVTVWPPYGLRCHNHAPHRGPRSLACGSRGAGVAGGAGSAGEGAGTASGPRGRSGSGPECTGCSPTGPWRLLFFPMPGSPSKRPRRYSPHLRTTTHLASSPTVTKVSQILAPARWRSTHGGARCFCSKDTTSVSMMTSRTIAQASDAFRAMAVKLADRHQAAAAAAAASSGC